MTRRLRKPFKNESGGALVEAGILFLPLCLIVFGIIEYGALFRDSLTLSAATRAAVRTGAAAPGTTSDVLFPAVIESLSRSATAATFTTEDRVWIYRADTNGNPAGDATCGAGSGSSSCVVYRFDSAGRWTQSGSFGWDPTTAATCLGGGPLDSIGVRLTQHHSSITGMFPHLDSTVLREKSVMTFEPTSSTTTGCRT